MELTTDLITDGNEDEMKDEAVTVDVINNVGTSSGDETTDACGVGRAVKITLIGGSGLDDSGYCQSRISLRLQILHAPPVL